MHITTVFLNTYSPNNPITGHCDIEHEGVKLTINFSEAECATIQQICVDAYTAHKQKAIDALMEHSPAYVGLPAPEQEGEEAEFTTIDYEIPY